MFPEGLILFPSHEITVVIPPGQALPGNETCENTTYGGTGQRQTKNRQRKREQGTTKDWGGRRKSKSLFDR